MAASVEQSAEDILKHGHPVSARKLFLRAHNYYRAAEFFASVKMSEAGDLYRRSLHCFDLAGALFDPPFESIRILYEELEQAQLTGLGHGLYAGGDLQLTIDAVDVGLHRAQYHDQSVGNFLILLAGSQQTQHFQFAFAQRLG